jgi:hypothetical protein
MALSDILERGYFPKELPDPFVTTSFASAVTTSGITLPAGFNRNPGQGYAGMPRAKPTKYSHARGGLLRRELCLPNPVLYYLLSCEIDSNWTALQPNISGTPLSATNPVFSPVNRAIDSARPQSARRELAVQTRLNNRYILRTDISRFYHSICTHSIPWALHTKTLAKTNHSMSLLGNRLDCLIRNGQDGQTVGIPIGPDTSLVIAEILMQKCDTGLQAMFPGMRGHRFIDDYELGFRHRSDAENAFSFLEKILADYELALNPRKTEIVELPCSLEAPWLSPLRSFPFRTTPSGQQGDLFQFFDLAFEFHRLYPDDGVLQYAVGRLRNLAVDPSNWELFQRFLLSCVAPEPATLPYVLQSIILRANAGAPPLLPEIEEVVNSLIIDHSALFHSSEVAWALWACLALGITLSPAATTAVSKCEDSVVALLALHCEAQGLVGILLDHTVWSSYMNQEDLYREHWLLAYEANIKGWLPSQGGGDHVSADPNFQFLKASGVSFYDKALAIPAAPGAPAPVPSPPTPPPVPSISPF